MLHSPDGKESARIIFHPGTNWEGYFTNDDILTQVDHAMTILSKYYPDEDRLRVYIESKRTEFNQFRSTNTKRPMDQVHETPESHFSSRND